MPKSPPRLWKKFRIRQRVVLACMGLAATTIAIAIRVCLHATLLIKTAHLFDWKDEGEVVISPYCEPDVEDECLLPGVKEKYTELMQHIMLLVFHAGYAMSHLPAGIVSDVYGGKWVLNAGIFFTGFFACLVPVVLYADDQHVYGFMVLLFFMGAAEGLVYPALNNMLAQWIPMTESGTLCGLAYSGGALGVFLGYAIAAAVLGLSPCDWTLLFYILGMVAVLWCLAFTILCSSDPASHKLITGLELEYLLNDKGHIRLNQQLTPPRWKLIFSSLAVWTMVLAQFAHDWCFYLVVYTVPKYMAMHFDLFLIGQLWCWAGAFCFMWLVALVCGVLADKLVKLDIWPRTVVRKIYTAGAALIVAVLLIGACFVRNIIFVVLFIIAMGLMGGYFPGLRLNPFDMTTDYAGILMGVTNGLGATASVLAAGTVSSSWEYYPAVLGVSFLLLCLFTLPYWFFASAIKQPWDNIPSSNKSTA